MLKLEHSAIETRAVEFAFSLCKLKYQTWLPLRPIEGQFLSEGQIKTRRECEHNCSQPQFPPIRRAKFSIVVLWNRAFFLSLQGKIRSPWQNQAKTRIWFELLSPSPPCFVCLALGGSRMFFVLSLHCWSWAHNKPNRCSTRSFSARFRLFPFHNLQLLEEES